MGLGEGIWRGGELGIPLWSTGRVRCLVLRRASARPLKKKQKGVLALGCQGALYHLGGQEGRPGSPVRAWGGPGPSPDVHDPVYLGEGTTNNGAWHLTSGHRPCSVPNAPKGAPSPMCSPLMKKKRNGALAPRPLST
ncbi:hypothetical protein O6H91_Y295600 [Diphasiastrum complanatum]|nr:hypothetical protein O6H91_Y295600 [Diphasiastrum complanatum]